MACQIHPRTTSRCCAAYAAFNARDIAAATALVTADVTWPRAFKAGVVQGFDQISTYWTEQWSEIDPHVAPTAFFAQGQAQVLVRRTPGGAQLCRHGPGR
ncbi:MAG: nuclear transport factor 2 family protein [Pseudoxanthomonas sp.]